jgi:Asp-tRNA(Asn)/Glu-tRNA(Gln) amidotransferase A subunit family amidase
MIENSDPKKKNDVNRRRFIQHLAILGASSLVVKGCSSPITEGEEGITIDTIKAAEKIFGIELTDDERHDVIEGLRKNLEGYAKIREKKLDEADFPSTMFNPLPAGFKPPVERKPFRLSSVLVQAPNRLEDICYLSVLELGSLLSSRQITSLELTRMYLSRLKKYDSKLKFVVNLTEDLALKQATKADLEIAGGNYCGPLHGIPYGIKDLFSVKDYPTTWGAKPFKDRIIDNNASVVRKLEKAGAVLVAKLSTGELASGEEWFGGKTRNPWKTSRPSGGSSAGPASATVAGCVAFSIGTESNGSMVSPCNECGVTGLRPTFGRVSRYGAMTTSWSFDKVTPICRTAEDCALVLNAIQGPDGVDNSVLDVPFNWDSNLDISKLRIGYHTKYFEKELLNNPSSGSEFKYRTSERSAAKKMLSFIESQGCELIPLDFEIDHSEEGIMMLVEAAAAHDEFSRSNLDDLIEDQKWPNYYRRYRFVPAVEYLQAARYRSRVINQMHEAMKDIDLYVEITWSNNWSTNESGHPIVVVPCGHLDGWRPATVTLVGKLFGEAEILAVAKTFQDATDYHLKRPTL